jgi:putative tricarboxylic transport membrane protein
VTCPLSGVPRFTFGPQELLGGITFIPTLIGLLGYAQVFRNIEKMQITEHVKSSAGKLLPKLSEITGFLKPP